MEVDCPLCDFSGPPRAYDTESVGVKNWRTVYLCPECGCSMGDLLGDV
jgi:predicted RNA-binding Zn-ribbon protein involved in translation (DUF1610 family)